MRISIFCEFWINPLKLFSCIPEKNKLNCFPLKILWHDPIYSTIIRIIFAKKRICIRFKDFTCHLFWTIWIWVRWKFFWITEKRSNWYVILISVIPLDGFGDVGDFMMVTVYDWQKFRTYIDVFNVDKLINSSNMSPT